MDFDASTPTDTHDANGNLTSDGVFQYQYDSANQLTNVVRTADGARVLSARYDALGRRMEATRADGSVERYVYFPGSFLVLAVLDGTNAVKEVYTRGPDLFGSLDGAGGIGGILACTYASGATYCSHADIMGNVIALTDASGSVAATFRYTPFGQLSARTGSVLPRYLFSSKEFDRTANLYYYGYRYYAPRLGRWMTRDPIYEDGFPLFFGGIRRSFAASMLNGQREENSYCFVVNNSELYFDPNGKKSKKNKSIASNFVPTPQGVALCMAQCAVTEGLGKVVNKMFEQSMICGKIIKHCQDNLQLPTPPDIFDGMTITRDDKGISQVLNCLGQCLSPTGGIEITPVLSFGKGGKISCNQNTWTVDYSFTAIEGLTIGSKSYDLNERPFSGFCPGLAGKLAWCNCCQFPKQ